MGDKDRFIYEALANTRYRLSEIEESEGEEQPRPKPYPVYKRYPDMPKIPLPEPAADDGPGLWQVLRTRRSLRRFTGEPITKQQLARILWAGCGVSGEIHGYHLRTAPSAGALFPVEPYLLVYQVTDLEPGVYHVDIPGFALDQLRCGDVREEMTKACIWQSWLSNSAAVLVWTLLIRRCAWKYEKRALRYLHHDAGIVSENVHLAASALRLGCTTIGAFLDEEVNHILDVDGISETASLVQGIGVVEDFDDWLTSRRPD